MDLDATKLELVQLLLQVKEESTLYKVKSILEKQKSLDWWEDLSADEKASIDEGIKQSERGETISHKEVMKVFDKWH